MSMNSDDVRREATRRVNAKKNFWRMAGGFLIVFIVCVVIWALSADKRELTFSSFWPIWPALGMGIALAYSGMAAFGPGKGTTEAEIQTEMRKMQGE